MSHFLVLVTGDRIGDALLKWPVISGLKRRAPELRITWIASRRASVFNGPLAELVKGTIDTTIEQAHIGLSWLELLRPAPPYQADIVVSTEPKLRHALLDRRIPHQRFISPAARFLLSDVKPVDASRRQVSVQDRLQELFELALGEPIELRHEVPITDTLLAQARQLLPPVREYIGLSPGAGGERKRWPLQRFIETAKTQQALGRTAVFFLGPEEAHLLGDIKAQLPTALFPEYDENQQRRGGAMLSIALAKQLLCAVANDSGGGHILAASGSPLVSLYGHTSAEKFKPRYGPHLAIAAKDFGSTEMTAITVPSVTQGIAKVLAA